MAFKMKNAKTGFTLVELLIVVGIIGLLATIGVIALDSSRAKGRNTKRVADVRQLVQALAAYSIDHGAYPTSPAKACLGLNDGATCWSGKAPGSTALNTALAPYMADIPLDPQSNRTYGDTYIYIAPNVPYSASWHCNDTIYPTSPLIIWMPDGAQPTTDAQCQGLGAMACCGQLGCGFRFCEYEVTI